MLDYENFSICRKHDQYTKCNNTNGRIRKEKKNLNTYIIILGISSCVSDILKIFFFNYELAWSIHTSDFHFSRMQLNKLKIIHHDFYGWKPRKHTNQWYLIMFLVVNQKKKKKSFLADVLPTYRESNSSPPFINSQWFFFYIFLLMFFFLITNDNIILIILKRRKSLTAECSEFQSSTWF